MRVVVVSEQPQTQHVIGAVLAAAGETSVGVAGVAECLETLAQRPFGVIVVEGPGSEGALICRRLKAAGTEVPVVLVLDELADRSYALGSGAEMILGRPFSADDLYEGIAEAIRQAARRLAGMAERATGVRN